MSRGDLGGTGPEAGGFHASGPASGPFELVAVSLPGTLEPAIPIAASRAGAVGILDLAGPCDPAAAAAAAERLFALGVPSQCGVLLDPRDEAVAAAVLDRLHPDARVWVHAAEAGILRRFITT